MRRFIRTRLITLRAARQSQVKPNVGRIDDMNTVQYGGEGHGGADMRLGAVMLDSHDPNLQDSDPLDLTSPRVRIGNV